MDASYGVEVGGKDEIVHLARLAVPLVDVADLAAEQETHFSPARRRNVFGHGRGEFRLESKQPWLGRLELFLNLGEPAGMGDIARRHHGDAFDLRPLPEMFQRQVFAGGAGVIGVDVKVSDNVHTSA